MESKDLKNSEELMRPVSDDSELTNEAGGSASSSVDNENEIVDETSPANEADEVTEESANVITETIEEPGDVTVEAEDPATADETAELQETVALEEPEVVETLPESSGTAAVVEPEVSEVTTEAEPEIVEAPVVAEESVEAAENLSSAEIQEAPAMEPESAPEEVNAAPALSGDEKKEIKEEPVSVKTENAETSEDETGENNEEEEYVEDEGHPDYSQFSQIELVNTLRELVENEDGQDRKINLIVAAFNLKVKENIAELKKRFVEEGGNPDEFVAEEDPYENDIRELIKKHRQARFEQAKKMEAEKETNLQKKYAIIEDIKNLLNTEESINKTFQEFRELQRLWYELGPVPQAKMKDLWDTYHFHVENFYDYIKINKELRDLDLKKNLEMKINLCEKAEELLIEPSVIRAFNTLQKFHEQWREIGPVPRDKKDEIWDRFKAVTSAINQKHQEFFEKRKGEQKQIGRAHV